ncbi:pilus assembly protein CpaB [Agromyces hippuratus]|uniref:Pilus assembly protein CpaB n=1 Tax=Agromyces hippuratus TaxID=286438 RepID=A0A852X1V1_9MICO|nr:Flp pilus assembly protein CpaB [Agromyces hippuratus]NYG22133.1 pilus assembly protein CpaB [Agromyces hippuratus]
MKTRIIGAIVALLLAVLGVILLVGYVRGADARAAQGAELTDVYVVQESIPRGALGEEVADFVELDSMPTRNVADGVVTNLEDLAGLVAVADILPGEQLLSARFVDPAELASSGDVPVPDGMQLVSFTLPADRVVGGQVRAGNTIGLVGTVDPDELGEESDVVDPVTSFAFHGVLVTKVQGVVTPDAEADTQVEQGAGDSIMLTIALSAHDIERWVWFTEGESAGYAQMWLTLENELTDNSGTSPVTGSNAF